MQIADIVDIVVLNYNNTGLIEPCINSIRNNTEGRYNLIAVDQNSKDGSREWLVQHAPHVILNKRNYGIAEGRNQGTRVGESPWIIFIDSDIIIEDKNWIDKLWNYTIDRRIGLIECRIKEGDYYKFSRMHFCMVRRQCFNEVGYFDKRFIVGADVDWLVRFQWSWWKTGYCYDTDIKHLSGGTLNGCLEPKKDKLLLEEDERMRYKYSPRFLKEVLDENIAERKAKEKELLYAK